MAVVIVVERYEPFLRWAMWLQLEVMKQMKGGCNKHDYILLIQSRVTLRNTMEVVIAVERYDSAESWVLGTRGTIWLSVVDVMTGWAMWSLGVVIRSLWEISFKWYFTGSVALMLCCNYSLSFFLVEDQLLFLVAPLYFSVVLPSLLNWVFQLLPSQSFLDYDQHQYCVSCL